MKLCFVLGTRPEIIKLSGLLRLCKERSLDHTVIHTGQHYSENMDAVFFKELGLAPPAHNLAVGSAPYGVQLSRIVEGCTAIFAAERPDVVIVEGDTNSVLGGALAAAKMGIPVAHVEAGLRSNDFRMAEEYNRIITDNVSRYLFAPTAEAVENLKRELPEHVGIHLTGNTIVEAVRHAAAASEARSHILTELSIRAGEYVLVTLHRAENVDSRENLAAILEGIRRICDKRTMKIILPLHPRTRKRLEEYGLAIDKRVTVIEPLGYYDFVRLLTCARVALTDSGGIQEEASILRVPCVTLRTSTERPETVSAGYNVLTGYDPQNILACFERMSEKKIPANELYGDGSASEKILALLTDER